MIKVGSLPEAYRDQFNSNDDDSKLFGLTYKYKDDYTNMVRTSTGDDIESTNNLFVSMIDYQRYLVLKDYAKGLECLRTNNIHNMVSLIL